MNILTIDRKENLSFEEFVIHYAMPQVPVILSNACCNWEAFSKWNLDFFFKNYGKHKVKVIICQSEDRTKGFNSYRGYKSVNRSFINMTMEEYLNYLNNSEDERLLYLIDWNIHQFNRNIGLLKDYQPPIYFDNPNSIKTIMDQFLRWIYIGKKGTFSRVHLDIFDTAAWNATLSGLKRWIFYPPSSETLSKNMNVNVILPNYAAYPFLANNRYECLTYPGDIIYTPSLWFHAVENLETGVSLTHNFVDKWNYSNVTKNLDSQVWYKRQAINFFLRRSAHKTMNSLEA